MLEGCAHPHDRRLVPRIETTVRIEALDGQSYCIAHDVGLGGMLVTTRDARWPGQLLRVRFRLPGEERAIRATCRVVDVAEMPRGVGLALQFVGLAAEAREVLRRFVRAQAGDGAATA